MPAPTNLTETDDPTRLLCAAAHRHQWFGDAVIRAYLVEEVGAVPPSPGLDTGAVLHDAVAARSRRRARDAVVLVLLLALALLDPLAMVVWAVVAVLARRRLLPGTRVLRWSAPLAGLGALALLVVVVLLKSVAGLGLPVGDRTWWPTLAIMIALLLVFVLDEHVGRRFLPRRFQPDRFVPDPASSVSALERWLRSRGSSRYAAQLERFSAADELSPLAAGLADVIVHRVATPYVGAGLALPRQRITIPPMPDSPVDRLDVAALHAHLATELRRPDPHRGADDPIGSVVHREQVVIPVEHLVGLARQGGTSFATTVMAHRDRPPLRHLPLPEARAVEQKRYTWARYYSCFRVESWNRNLVISCYLYVTTQFGLVQMDLTPCVLPPVQPWLKETDQTVPFGEWPVNAGAVALLALPLTAPLRLWSLLRPMTPRNLRTAGIRPERYGAGRSLREGVSSGLDGARWYEADDAAGTVAAVTRRLFEAAGPYLQERGFDVSELRKNLSTTIEKTSLNIYGGNFEKSNIANGDINPPAQPTPEAPSGRT